MAHYVKLNALDDLVVKARDPAVQKLVEEALLGGDLPAADATAADTTATAADSRPLADGDDGDEAAGHPGG